MSSPALGFVLLRGTEGVLANSTLAAATCSCAGASGGPLPKMVPGRLSTGSQKNRLRLTAGVVTTACCVTCTS